MLPAAITGLGRPSSQATLVAGWYAGLTLFALAVAYRNRGLHRAAGLLIIGAYLVFLGSLLAIAYAVLPAATGAIAPAVAIAVRRGYDPCRPGAAVGVERPKRVDERPGRSAIIDSARWEPSGAARRRPPRSRNVTSSQNYGGS
jgi:hypothetical protein